MAAQRSILSPKKLGVADATLLRALRRAEQHPPAQSR
jgi:hypothetical protein